MRTSRSVREERLAPSVETGVLWCGERGSGGCNCLHLGRRDPVDGAFVTRSLVTCGFDTGDRSVDGVGQIGRTGRRGRIGRRSEQIGSAELADGTNPLGARLLTIRPVERSIVGCWIAARPRVSVMRSTYISVRPNAKIARTTACTERLARPPFIL